jgi:hypothetical protein
MKIPAGSRVARDANGSKPKGFVIQDAEILPFNDDKVPLFVAT